MRFFSLTLIFITLVVPVAIATNNQEKLSTQVVNRLAQQPDFDYYFAEALRQKHLGNTAESIDLFLKSYDINPTSAIVSFELGNLFLQQKADDMGFGYIKNAAELAPQNYFYQEKLALLYRSNGDFSKAIEVLERIQRLFPDKDEVLYELSQLYTQNGQHKKSIQKLDLLEKRIGLNKAITYDKAVQYVLLKNIKQAHKEIDAMLKKTPNDHALWILKGDIEYERKKYGNAKKIIGVVSGKGGVGKSTVTAVLAIKLAEKGYKVGVLDGDIIGPSIPRIFGKEKLRGNVQKITETELKFAPIESKSGIKLASFNFYTVNEDQAVMWRGPIISSTLSQIYQEVEWGELDYLLIDMPPGTGDTAITVMQSFRLDGIIAVGTPQKMVTVIVKKLINMAQVMNIPVIGVVENLAHIIASNGEKLNVWGKENANGCQPSAQLTHIQPSDAG